MQTQNKLYCHYQSGGSCTPLVKLAIHSVEHFIETVKPLPCPDPLPKNLKQNAGTFVTVKKQDSLRGCIDTLTPKHKNLAEEIIRNAIRAADNNPRFDPIEKRELTSLIIWSLLKVMGEPAAGTPVITSNIPFSMKPWNKALPDSSATARKNIVKQ